MAHQALSCPICKEPVEGLLCTNDSCKADLRAFANMSPNGTDPVSIIKGLAGTGRVYFDSLRQSLVIRGWLDKETVDIGFDFKNAEVLARFVQSELRYSPKQFGILQARATICWLHQRDHAPLPTVERQGDYPLFRLSEDGEQLFFPAISSDLSRYMGQYLYTGEAIQPHNHSGLFERWLASFRCATDADRDVLRGWCVGVMLQGLLPPGLSPGLLITARAYGVGKTTTANMLSCVFGSMLTVNWKKNFDDEAFCRKIVGSNFRFVLIDNVTPDAKTNVFHSSMLSTLVTSPTLTLKRLYRTYGSTTQPNHFLYLMTANVPVLSPELLSRFLLLTLTAHPTADETKDWLAEWVPLRTYILEDLMWLCVNGWAKGAIDVPVLGYRHEDWLRKVARVLRVRPAVCGTAPAIQSCYEFAMKRVFMRTNRIALKLSQILSGMQFDLNPAVRLVMAQRQLTPESALRELLYCPSLEAYEENNETWIKMKS